MAAAPPKLKIPTWLAMGICIRVAAHTMLEWFNGGYDSGQHRLLRQNPLMTPSRPAAADEFRSAVGLRRYVTVLFSDLSESSELAGRLEAEEYAELLEQFRSLARQCVPRHGGSIARLQGDGVLALFGHLGSREDDGRRATEAALDLHAAVAQLSAGSGTTATMLSMHSGIHAGLVLLIEGDIERGRVDVFGQVPNTAARLCGLAASGEILVSNETLGPQADYFQVHELQQIPIRGLPAPINVLRVDGRNAVAHRINAATMRGVVPFNGRSHALSELNSVAKKARSGDPAFVLVSGEPGIGKTRLIDEFQRQLDHSSFRVLHGHCENYLGAVPLQPFMQSLRDAFGWRAGASSEENEAAADLALMAIAGALPAENAPVARALLGLAQAIPSAPSPAIFISVLIDLIAALAKPQTLVLILDDWQWADDASRQALEVLRARSLPLFLLLATRPTGDDDHAVVGAQTMHLQPLDATEGADAIAARLPVAEPLVSMEIYRQSGGNPLFLEELCHAAARGDFQSAETGVSVAWINALVVSRLERLPEPQIELLRIASVVGNEFATWLLEQVIGTNEAIALLEAVTIHDFLVSARQPGMLRFKHVLTHDAVYATVDPKRRRALHLRVAQVLDAAVEKRDAVGGVEALSYHYNAAGISDRAAHFAEAAGDKALAAMALDRARAQYTTALRSLDSLPDLDRTQKLRWCSIAQKLGQTCVFDPLDVAHGLELFARAASLARQTCDENTLARAEYWLGYVCYGKGRPKEAVRHCQAALNHAIASNDLRLAAQVQATLGQSFASAGQYGQALPLMAQAVESKRQKSRPGSGVAIGSAYTLGRTAFTLGDLGRFDQAHAVFDDALRLLGDNLHSVGASVKELMCVVYLWQGRWAEARAAGLEGAEMALRCRSRYLIAMGRALGACGSLALGTDRTALQSLRESTRWIEARGGAVSTSLNYGWLVDATVALGLEQEARAHAARLFMRSRAQDRHGEAIGCRALARLAASHDDTTRVGHYLRIADRAAEFRASPREKAVNNLTRAKISADAGKTSEAKALAEVAGEAFETMNMQWYLDRSRRLLQQL